ncbi:MAG TPA: DUF488 family protein [Gammaproteobacteria bacterium]
MAEPDIRLKRAYAAASRGDGYRVLVDRVWPRGRSKAELALDDWCKDIAPSDALRKWFGHEVSRWAEFRRRYRAELRDKGELLDSLLDKARPRLTLVFGAADEEHNQAVVLRARLLERHRKTAR